MLHPEEGKALMRSSFWLGRARPGSRSYARAVHPAAGVPTITRLGVVKRVLLTIPAAVVALLVLVGTPASASTTHNLLSSFGSLAGVEGVAVDESTGDVYVYEAFLGDTSTWSVLKFNAAGEPAEFSATKTDGIAGVGSLGEGKGEIAVDNSSGPAKGDIYVATGSHLLTYASDGSMLGELNSKVESEVPAAQGTWSEPCGVTVDSTGNVYVGLWPQHVNEYSPHTSTVKNADYVSSLSGLNSVCNIAADSAGDIYTDSLPSGPVTKYGALQFGLLEASGTPISNTGGKLSINLATNHLYVDTGSGIAVYGPEEALLETFDPSSEAIALHESSGIAVDGTSGNIYLSDSERHRIDVFGPAVVKPDATLGSSEPTSKTVKLNGAVNPNGVAATCEFEYGTSKSYGGSIPCSVEPGSGASPVNVSAEPAGLEAGVVYHYRLTVTNANGVSASEAATEDATFALLSPPTIFSESSENVAISAATLDAVIGPMSFSTSYHVEYGTDTSYGTSVPVPDAELGAFGPGGQAVHQAVAGLQPGTTYHYRFVAKNANGTTVGPDQAFTTSTELSAEQSDTCPNAALRAASSAHLPDCRAYEMVSPANKDGADVNAQQYKEFTVAESGNHVMFPTRTDFGETHGSGHGGYTQYIADRGADGWVSKGIDPTPAQDNPWMLGFGSTRVELFSSELNRAVVVIGLDPPGATGGIPDRWNLYLENTADVQLIEPITRFEGTEEVVENLFSLPERASNASSDLGVVTFQTSINLLPQASGNSQKLYASDHGKLYLVGIMPDGSVPSAGSEAAAALHEGASTFVPNTVSKDGSRILFKSRPDGSGAPQLYLRKDEQTTAWVSQSEATTPNPEPQEVYFQAATPDDKKVFFTSSDRLLDSDPGVGGVGLYMYTDGPDPENESNLTFIARVDEQAAGRGKAVLGVSQDGSHVYFFADHSSALPFDTDGGGDFLWDDGQIRQVAPTPDARDDREFTQIDSGEEEAHVSDDGRQIAFMNPLALTSQEVAPDGTLPAPGAEGNSEMYVYDEDRNTLKCVSCPPGGATAIDGIEVNVLATAAYPPGFNVVAPPHFLSRDGRFVFFNTVEALLPQDTNKLTDAYEYNTETGKLSLLSSGGGESGTWFVDASPSGRDAFLVTKQPLTRTDPDKLDDLYDARIDGGFPEPLPTPAPCAGDACQGTPAAVPSFNTASGFSGLGNQPPPQAAHVKPKKLTNAQHLKSALKACSKRPRRNRAACRAKARRRYPVKKSVKHASRRAGR